MAIFQPVIFNLDNECYGLDIENVNAIEHYQDVVRVPNASKNIKGIINLRGEVIPVYDLRAKFNTPNQQAVANSEFIIVKIGENKIAIEVDGVQEIHNFEESQMVEMPLIAKGEGVDYFQSVARIDNKLVIIVNPKKLLTEAELEAVEQLVEDTKSEE